MLCDEVNELITWKYSRNPDTFTDAFFTAMVDNCVKNITNSNDTAKEIYKNHHRDELDVPNGDNLYKSASNEIKKVFISKGNNKFGYNELSDRFGNKVLDQIVRIGNIRRE